MELKSIKTKIRYDRESRAALYKIGDKVCMLELKKSKKKSKKFTRKWKGPFEVIKVLNEQNLRIKSCSKNDKSTIVHKILLKRSYDRSKLDEDVPKYRNRADQKLKMAPNLARGEIESASSESTVDEDALRAEVNDEESDVTASETHSLTADEGSDEASHSETLILILLKALLNSLKLSRIFLKINVFSMSFFV